MKYFLNPNDIKSAKLSNKNFTVISYSSWGGVRSNIPINNTKLDKVYIECYVDDFNSNNSAITLLTKNDYFSYHSGYYYWCDGNDENMGWNVGDTIGVLYDKTLDNGTLSFSLNGKIQPLKYNNLNKEILYLGIIVYEGAKTQRITVNFGQKPFKNKPYDYSSLENFKYLIMQNDQYYSLNEEFFDKDHIKYKNLPFKSLDLESFNKGFKSTDDFFNKIEIGDSQSTNIGLFNDKFKLLIYKE